MISLEKLLFSTYRKLKVPLRRLRSGFQAKQPSDLLTEQEESFRNLGLVRDVDAVISNFPSLKSLASQGLVSEHYPLFASIAASGLIKIRGGYLFGAPGGAALYLWSHEFWFP